jgi:CRISPR/Cas system CMR-associated protein Cmr3 (group 5 of RAMP superfamily)
MRSSEMLLELWLLRYRAKGRNEQNVVGVFSYKSDNNFLVYLPSNNKILKYQESYY